MNFHSPALRFATACTFLLNGYAALAQGGAGGATNPPTTPPFVKVIRGGDPLDPANNPPTDLLFQSKTNVGQPKTGTPNAGTPNAGAAVPKPLGQFTPEEQNRILQRLSLLYPKVEPVKLKLHSNFDTFVAAGNQFLLTEDFWVAKLSSTFVESAYAIALGIKPIAVVPTNTGAGTPTTVVVPTNTGAGTPTTIVPTKTGAPTTDATPTYTMTQRSSSSSSSSSSQRSSDGKNSNRRTSRRSSSDSSRQSDNDD